MRPLTQKADALGDAVTPDPKLMIVGSGESAYLWIGNANGFIGVARNTPQLRKFLRRALARLEERRKGAK